VERSRFHIAWLLAAGAPTAEVARVTGYSETWVREVAGRTFADLAALEETLADRCRALRAAPATVGAHTRFAWWPTDPPPQAQG
jgi:hypothetical protein